MTMVLRVSVALIAALSTLTPALAATGSLKVTSFPSGAEVWVDGVNSGKVTPMSISLPEGDHTVTVQLPNSGWNPDTRTVTIVAGNNDLSVTLLPVLTAGPPGVPGQPGAPAAVRLAAPGECPTGGIVVTSGNGDLSVPVCNGAQGPPGIQGIQGAQGLQGIQGEPGQQGLQGPAGQAATVRMAGSSECATGGIVVTSGNGDVSLPVCHGAQGLQGIQGIQGLQGIQGIQGETGARGPMGPAGPAGGGAPAVDPTTLVGFGINLSVRIGDLGYRPLGLSPVYVVVDETIKTADGLVYSPGQNRVAPFAIAASTHLRDGNGTPIPDYGPDLVSWFDAARQNASTASRTVGFKLTDTQGVEKLAVEMEDCVPIALDTGFGGVARVVVDCPLVSFFAATGGNVTDSNSIFLPGGISQLFVQVDRTGFQFVSDVSGGGKRFSVSDDRERDRAVDIDPLRMRTGLANNDPDGQRRMDTQGLTGWIAASLNLTANHSKFQNIELLGRDDTVVAAYQDMFLTVIGLLDPAGAIGGGQTELGVPGWIRVGFDLVMRVGDPQF